MSDIVDQANRLIELQNKQAIQNARNASVQSKKLVERDGVRYCADCDKEIPKARIKAIPRATLCISCTTAREKAEGASYDGYGIY